jgi:hypothetical protein
MIGRALRNKNTHLCDTHALGTLLSKQSMHRCPPLQPLNIHQGLEWIQEQLAEGSNQPKHRFIAKKISKKRSSGGADLTQTNDRVIVTGHRP